MSKRAKTELTFITSGWSCPLQSGFCAHEGTNGRRCRNRVCIGAPLCGRHNELKYGVKIKQSTIIDAGKGLFATRDIPKGSWICPYAGETMTMSRIHRLYPGDMTAPYVLQIPGPENLAVDCSVVRGIGSLANAHFNKNGAVAALSRHNCFSRFRPVGGGEPGVWLKSLKLIRRGEEIFNWYGEGNYRLETNHSTRRRAAAPDSRPC